MKNSKLHSALLGGALLLCFSVALVPKSLLGQSGPPGDAQLAANQERAKPAKALSKDERMAWWRAARFGMFVHWGLYAVPGGLYQGEKPKGDYNYQAEWLQSAAKVPAATYAEYAKEFNPQKFDADAWVKLAKEAGMKYLIVTAKHHEGFAMFKSAASPFNIVDATPYKRDPLAKLAAACHKNGIKLGFYYSQNFDWHHPGGGGADWDPAHVGDPDAYVDKIVIPQLRELLTNYGEVSVLWWDIPNGVINRERGERIMQVVDELAPNIIMNNRLGGGFHGDTETPEQTIPANGFPGRDWEVCMTMNNTWGYSSTDKEYKSVPEFLHNLIDIVSKGGNYLLNVGPDAEGVIPQPQVERLKGIGAWLKVNGKAIYGAQPSPLASVPDWGRVTRKGNRLYLHVLDWPRDGQLLLPISNAVKQAHLLATPRAEIKITSGPQGIRLTLPTAAPDAVASVIELEIQGEVRPVATTFIQPNSTGAFTLPATEAQLLSSQNQMPQFFREKSENKTNIGNWTTKADFAQWKIQVPQPGSYKVSLEYSTIPNDNAFTIQGGSADLRGILPPTGGWNNYRTDSFGTLHFDQAGATTLTLQPETINGLALCNLRTIQLTPVDAHAR